MARGEVALGIVNLSDALAEARGRVVAAFPPPSHRPIVYSGIAITGGDRQVARRMLDHLRSDA